MSPDERRKSDKRRLISFVELPSWAHDNEFITHGYRAPGGTKESLSEREKGERASTVRVSDSSSSALRKRRKQPSEDDDHAKPTTSWHNIEEHDSFRRCWESVWMYAHNETVNIHTHLWGAIVSIVAVGLHVAGAYGALPSWLMPITHHAVFYPRAINPIPPSTNKATSLLQMFKGKPVEALRASPLAINALFTLPGSQSIVPWSVHMRANDVSDWLGFASFLFGAVTVLSCSATFHTVGCHSASVSKTYNKLDYIGIVAMIVGSFLPILHYGFYCHVRLQAFYSALILTLGAFATYTVLSQKYTSPAYRPIRTSVFIALGCSAVFPVAHILSMYGYETVSRTMGLNFLVAGGALYIVGACLYMARIPERFSPGTFDYVGASHQLFHVFILFAAFSHYVCVRRSYVFWHTVEAISTSSSKQANMPASQAVCAAFELLRNGRN